MQYIIIFNSEVNQNPSIKQYWLDNVFEKYSSQIAAVIEARDVITL